MKKVVVGILLAVMVFGASYGVVNAAADEMSFGQFIELLIASGLIPQDRIPAARSLITESTSFSIGAAITPPATGPAAQGSAAAIAATTTPMVDIKLNGLDSATVVNGQRVTVSWNAQNVRSCTGSGSAFGLATGGQWGMTGPLATSSSSVIIAVTNATLPSTVTVGVSCQTSNYVNVNDHATLTLVSSTANQATTTAPANASISVTYPNGGEWLSFGAKDQDFRTEWQTTNLPGTVSIHLVFADGAACYVGSAPASRGYFVTRIGTDFQCPNVQRKITDGRYYALIVADMYNKTIQDRSDSLFNVVLAATGSNNSTGNNTGSNNSNNTTANTGTNGISYTTVPSSVVAGTTFSVTVTNSGTKTWSSGHDLGLRSTGGTNLQFADLDTTAAGARKTVSLTAPAIPGSYYLNAVEQGVAWFGEAKSIAVTAASSNNNSNNNSGQQAQPQPISGTLSVGTTCVVPGTNVTATAIISGDGVSSSAIEKDTNQDGVYGTAASWGSGTGTRTYTTGEDASYSGRIDLKLLVNGQVRDSKSITVSTACAPAPSYTVSRSCTGTEPSGDGVTKGSSTYSSGYGVTQWAFLANGTPGACQYVCQAGYTPSGSSCQPSSSSNGPSLSDMQPRACSGTEPSGQYVAKGHGQYTMGYGVTSWSYTGGTPQACQFSCANGATWNGAACAVQTPTVSISANTSCAAVGSTITVTSHVSGSPIQSNWIERDTPAQDSAYGDGVFGGRADYGANGGAHSYTQAVEREGYYDFTATVNGSLTSSVRVFAGQSCGQTSTGNGTSNLGAVMIGYDSIVKLINLFR